MTGIDFQSADLCTREAMALVQGQVTQLLQKVYKHPEVLGCVLLATCNRTELYLHTQSAESNGVQILEHVLGKPLHGFVNRKERAVVQHLFAVTAGMQSQIFGDDQILSQVGQAARLAREYGCTDSVLDTLFRHAVTTGKRVKTETHLVGVPTSAAHEGIRVAENLLHGLEKKHAVVIGNGEMGRLAATLLRAKGCQVTITLRTYRHGETIVPAGCQTYGYEQRYEVIDGADLVVSATTSPHHTLTLQQMKTLAQPPQVMIDLAMPRDLEPSITQLGIQICNLNDLGTTISPENDVEREKAEKILEEGARDFFAWYEYRKALPLIAQMKDTALTRVKFDPMFAGLYAEQDLEGLLALTANKTIDMLLGGMKDILTAEQVEACLQKMQKGISK